MWPRRIGARAWMAAVAALAIVLVFVSGCGKDDEPLLPPVIGDPQGSPDDAWQCLQRSLDSHTGEAWSDAIGLDFQYVPDSASAANHPHRFDAWSRATELAFVGALFAATVDFEAQMLPTEFAVLRPQGSQVMWTEVPYSVRVDGRGGGHRRGLPRHRGSGIPARRFALVPASLGGPARPAGPLEPGRDLPDVRRAAGALRQPLADRGTCAGASPVAQSVPVDCTCRSRNERWPAP